jgi:signal transduction histidine kinase
MGAAATISARRYEAERRRLFHRRMVIGSLVAMVLIPLFGIADYFTYRPYFAVLFGARLVSLVISAAIFGLLRYRFGRHDPLWLGIALTVEAGLAIAGVPVYVTGIATPHYVSMSLLILSVAALMPWQIFQLAFVAGVLAAMFIGGALLHGSIANANAFMTEVSAILVTGAIALLITDLSERMRSREFAARRELQRASKEKTRLIEHLRQKSAELEMLNQEMEDLLYVASHDLRAPLINVQGFANEVTLGLDELRAHSSEGPDAARIRADIEESLGFIRSAISRMDALIGGLLNVSRVATRTNPTQEVRLQTAVETIIESFRYQLEQQRIAVRVGPLPAVRGDPVRLTQVFSNLVDNAIKYMGDGPRREIEIGLRNGNDTRPTFFVRDTGPGIPAESHDTVFRLFRRLAVNGVPGEGLGLTMVRKIVEKHGGRIWIESSPGQGSTFCFTLGRERDGSAAASSEPTVFQPLSTECER